MLNALAPRPDFEQDPIVLRVQRENDELVKRGLTDDENRRVARRDGYYLRLYGDPILSTPTVPVSSVEAIDAQLVDAMLRALEKPDYNQRPGAGLAANQVGGSQSIIIARLGGKVQAMVNPRILRTSEELVRANEGCLSIPGYVAQVARAAWVDVEWQDLAFVTHFARFGAPTVLSPVGTTLGGEELQRRAEDYKAMPEKQWQARIIQHELEHLRGESFVDGLSRTHRRAAQRTADNYRRQAR